MTWRTDIQANILRGVRADAAYYLFCAFGDQAALRTFLTDAIPNVRSAAWQRDHLGRYSVLEGEAILNIALTRQGLNLALTDDEESAVGYQSDTQRRGISRDIETDAFAFRSDVPTSLTPGGISIDPGATNSMYRRLDLLGEAPRAAVPESDTWRWDPFETIHVLAWITGDAASASALAVDIEALVTGAGGGVVNDREGEPLSLQGATLPGEVDPFGFRDGVVQPAVAGYHAPAEFPGRGAVSREGWRGLRPGEFIVGETDEGDERRRPLPADVLFNCTYLAFRQIRMWPERLDALTEADPVPIAPGSDQLAARLVGRHRPNLDNEGTSVIVQGPEDQRGFLYGDDPEGRVCPVGAHIRRANPRDSMGKDGQRVNRHRIIRRGMPYATTYQGDPEEGLMFISLQARLEDQFEFVQAHWLNVAPTLHVGEEPDPIGGNAVADVESPSFYNPFPGSPVVELSPSEPLTQVLGGEYFVMPTITGLRNLIAP